MAHVADAIRACRYCSHMRLRLCGTRGSTPAPGVDFARYGGQTSCVAVLSDDGECRLILDAGTGLRRLPAALEGRPFSGSMLLTHLHWDHTHGLPFCPSVDNPDARTTLYIPEQPGGDAEEILARAMSPPHFPIRPREMRGSWEFRASRARRTPDRGLRRPGAGDSAQGRPDVRVPRLRRARGRSPTCRTMRRPLSAPGLNSSVRIMRRRWS